MTAEKYKRDVKMKKCSYCNKVAEVRLGMVRLGMDDPDAEMMPYCKECAEKVRMNTLMEIPSDKNQSFKKKIRESLKLGKCNMTKKEWKEYKAWANKKLKSKNPCKFKLYYQREFQQ